MFKQRGLALFLILTMLIAPLANFDDFDEEVQLTNTDD